MKYKVYYKGIWWIGDTQEKIIKKILDTHPNIKSSIIQNVVTNGLVFNEKPMRKYGWSKKDKKLKQEPISFDQMVRGANALVKVVSGNTVSQEEINRRSSICSSCLVDGEYGVISTNECRPCGFAKNLNNYINKLKRSFGKGFEIPNNLSDKGCIVCKCALSVMLPSQMDSFNYEGDKQDKRPHHCWVKKSSPNFKG